MVDYCIESDCVTVWYKRPGEVIRGNLQVTNNRTNNSQVFGNVTGYSLTEIGRYCSIDYEEFNRVLREEVNVDFEISGEVYGAPNAQRISVPRMQVKRLLFGILKPQSMNQFNMKIYYCNETNPDNTCNWTVIDPRDYGGETEWWHSWYTNVIRHSWEYERCELKVYRDQDLLHEDTVFGYELRDSHKDCFNLNWFNIQERASAYWDKIEIPKEPNNQKIEVVPFAYNFIVDPLINIFVPFGFAEFINPFDPELDLPRNCLNIYKSVTEPITFPWGGEILSRLTTLYIDQICTSDPGDTEPPEYFVTCNCDGLCPSETCQVECSTHFCCYDSTGQVVLTIPKG